MALNLWVIIGESDSGKSTAIRRLAGFSETGNTKDFADIVMKGGGLKRFFAKLSAFQEAPDGKEGPEGALKYIEKKWSTELNEVMNGNCLIALRHRATDTMPSSFDYLDWFVKNGCEIEKMVVLEDENIVSGDKNHYINYGVDVLFWNVEQENEKARDSLGTPEGLLESAVTERAISNKATALRKHFEWA